MVSARDEAERALAKALSRHIGYTTAAYDLQRIFATLRPFSSRTSAYKDELIAFLGPETRKERGEPASTGYLAEVLSFATALGLLEIVSSREAKLVRYAATEVGRSVLGATAVGQDDFTRYFATMIVLRADADYVYPLLTHLKEASLAPLNQFFVSFQETLRVKRLDWLTSIMPETILLERVVRQIPWLRGGRSPTGKYAIDVPTLNTARHHATPRHGWLVQLGMYDPTSHGLTDFGHDVLRSLAPNQNYFWLAPPKTALEVLGISDASGSQSEDAINFADLLQEATPEDAAILVDDVARVMRVGYTAARLVHAPQASLLLPIEYISFRCYRDRKRYDWQTVLDDLFRSHRADIQRYSAIRGKIGFYRALAGA